MATDTVPPDATVADNADGYQQPQVDIGSLRQLLDGRYVDVREMVRRNLSDYASVLDDAETMGHDEFRERVKDVTVAMAATGQTGLGFPEEYGGGGDIGAMAGANW